ncbi:SAM-dependent methyltransferase [Pyrinomonas methylaliphatogenes]|uniref:Ribosomal protein L11 methylase n=1 Tax=Pyrinomonas methylaliphatogenes TaxID=454194 RepID=A0A0B6WW74_9BACT|nr:class I SAM-dependent methyltransferase [Pyrinomonas methylaliphatogenes]CDM65346.1 ribosomal protein L11 methylase [Pyrinomonas methylaliphatogenes]
MRRNRDLIESPGLTSLRRCRNHDLIERVRGGVGLLCGLVALCCIIFAGQGQQKFRLPERRPPLGLGQQAPHLDVPYVPTPPEVVDAMLRLAAVTKDDVVYDLGCGDGRIVIAAAKKYGARGVGVDIDPQRIREANENARKEGVADRVRFVQQDLFQTDIHDATVVTLYLLPDVNMRLRPKLWRELRPGARVVSHAFTMGDWEPEKTIDVNGRMIYLWTIPPKRVGSAGTER